MSAPTEAMCDAARWFILARDGGHFTWGSLARCKPPGKTIPYVEQQMAENPKGHITKWDMADCIYQLMETVK